jgi:NADPH2:quinone reductase
LKALAVRGMLVVFGKASGELPEINPFVLAPRALQMCWPILPQYVSTRDELVRAAADLFAAVRLGHVDATPDRTYSFDDLIEAHDDLEQRRTTGSIVLKIT